MILPNIISADERETINYNERIIQKGYDMFYLVENGVIEHTVSSPDNYYIETIRTEGFLSKEYVKIIRDKDEPRLFKLSRTMYKWQLNEYRLSPTSIGRFNEYSKEESFLGINSYHAAKLLYDNSILIVEVGFFSKQIRNSEIKYQQNRHNI